jgi:hypothetical protein
VESVDQTILKLPGIAENVDYTTSLLPDIARGVNATVARIPGIVDKVDDQTDDVFLLLNQARRTLSETRNPRRPAAPLAPALRHGEGRQGSARRPVAHAG